MSALQSALAELRACAADRISVGLSAGQCAALAQHIDQLQQAVLEADDRPEGWSATVADTAAKARALVPGRQDTAAETTAEQLPHEDYMQAVFDAIEHFGLHPKGVTTTTPDGLQLDGVISFPAAEFPERWPDGVYLGWDQRGGWSLCDEGTDRNLWDLDLDTYANPAAVADRARTRLLDLPDTAPDETWDGALDLRDAVAVWESGDGADGDAPSCRDCGTWPCARHATHEDRAEHAAATGTGYRAGDIVEIHDRDETYNGKTGIVVQIDEGDGEFPIGLDVEGFLGLVWCHPSEIRHVEPAPAESGAAS